MLKAATLVLEMAREPIWTREIHAATEQLTGESLRWPKRSSSAPSAVTFESRYK